MKHISKARKAGFHINWKLVGLVVVAISLFWGACTFMVYGYFNPAPPPVVQISDAQYAQYKRAARRSLEKLCEHYGCPAGYVDEAVLRVKFLQTADFALEAKKDGNLSTETGNVIAFTTKKEPRWIFVNLDQINKVPGDMLGFLERVLDHEVVHQAAVEQKVVDPLIITFSNKKVFAGDRSYGTLLLDNQGIFNLYYVNEAYTQWLAESQIHKDFPGFARIYTEGPRIVERFSYKMGLSREVAFGLYTNKGVAGFIPFYEKLVTPPLSAVNSNRRTAALYIILFISQTLNELNDGKYSLDSAQKRIQEYIATGLAPRR